MGRQFDVIIMNPPYQPPSDVVKTGGSGARNTLWPSFVKKGLSLCRQDGFCAFIHPPKWRKPEDKLWSVLSQKKMKYLEIHDSTDGKKTFGAATRYDWYILQNSKNNVGSSLGQETNIVDGNGVERVLDLSKLPFLPNYNFDEFRRILAKENEETLNVIFSYSAYETRKSWMSPVRTKDFQYPCVHSLYQDGGISLWYSSQKSEFFVPKVIINGALYPYPTIDIKGQYGICQDVFGIRVDSLSEAEKIKKAINSVRFGKIIAASKWSSFRIDYRMFKYFKRDFWRLFIDENGNEIPAPTKKGAE